MPSQRDLWSRVSDALNSNSLNVLIGIAGLAVPIAGWVFDHIDHTIVIVVETALLLLVVASKLWSNKTHIHLRRTNGIGSMADPLFYDAIRAHLERTLTSDYRGIADGYLSVVDGEVPRLSVMLVDTLMEAGSQPQRILATDRTTNPALLLQRRDYLNANRRFIEQGGRVDRLFVVARSDLLSPDFAGHLLALVDRHRQIGVHCGLAVDERLNTREGTDAVVFAHAAVLIEELQGDAAYSKGRSTLYFKDVDVQIGHFTRAWERGVGASAALDAYEARVRPLLEAWDEGAVSACVDSL
ncbi:hypothetical protein AB0J38_21750 [Streptomyces sp. NPDC050095]|uniref:hypothetical protein n=1 Tax=unclassified Streptomyces TaxID=2593676 RepID=UPI00343F8E49